jgi:hypothetical protein
MYLREARVVIVNADMVSGLKVAFSPTPWFDEVGGKW